MSSDMGSTEKSTKKRRRPPPAWVILIAGVLFFVAAWVRHASDSARGWEVSAIFGVVTLIFGVVVAVRRRSLTSSGSQ